MTIPKTILTKDLKPEDVTLPEPRWRYLAAFAQTYDPHEMGGYGCNVADLKNASPSSSVAELRAHLYVEQRRWNHFGEEPDMETMGKLIEIMVLIRQKVQSETDRTD